MLNDINALNHALGLNSERKLIEFESPLLKLMQLRKWDRVFPDYVANYASLTDAYKNIGYAWCGVANGSPVCAFGLVPLWNGVGEVWMLTDVRLPRFARTFHRVSRQMFNIYIEELNMIRLQCTVHSRNLQARKWIESMYFKKEGLLKQYGPDGHDFFMFARIKDGRNIKHTQSTSTSSGT